MRDDNVGAVHLTVLSAMPGRLRLQLEKPIEGEAIFLSIPGLQSCRYNPRIQTMLCCYDKAVISESDLLRCTPACSRRRCCTSSTRKKKASRWHPAAIWRLAALSLTA